MPQNLGDWVSALLGVLAIASLAGYGSMRARLRDLKTQLDESRAETAAVRTGRADDRLEQQESEAKIATLTADLAALGRMVRGDAEWSAATDELRELRGELRDHNTKAEAHWVSERTFWRRFEPKGQE